MSLSELSTELDHHIIRLLSHGELDSLSRVSKYYRGLAEPYHYESLQFSNAQGLRIMQFFHTIVRRQDLAQHVRSFALTDDGGSGSFDDPTQFNDEESWQSIDVIKDVIANITKKRNWDLASRLLGSVLCGNRSVDGLLAVILCLAKWMNSLALSTISQGSLGIT